MKKTPLIITCLTILTLIAGCTEESDLAIDRIAAPALITFAGGPKFALDENVVVTAEFRELRKNGVNIDTLGAAPDIQTIRIEATNGGATTILADNVTLSNGTAELNLPWSTVLGAAPESGMSTRLEFAGTTTGGGAFRKYYTISVE